MLGDITDEIRNLYDRLRNEEPPGGEPKACADFARDQLAARRRAEFERDHHDGKLCITCLGLHLDPRHNFADEDWKAAAHEELTRQGQ